MENEIRQTRLFSQSPQEVWEYLTKPELLEQWLGESDFEPIVGHKFRFIGACNNDSYCEVLEVRPFTRLSYSWQKNSSEDGKPFYSKVVWTLVPKEGGTELRLVHRGLPGLGDSIAHNSGWNHCLDHVFELLHSTSYDFTK